MKQFSLTFIAAAALGSLAGCATAGAERDVRVTSNPEVVRGCRFLGNVKESFSSSKGWGLMAAKPENTLRKKTVALGGNALFVVSSGEHHASGEAYDCSGVSLK